MEAEKALTAVEVFMRALMEASAGLGLEVGEAPRPSVAADAPAD